MSNIFKLSESLNDLEQTYINNNNITLIRSDDFKKGTYRIINPGIYRFTEDIVIEPNSKDTCFPTFSQNKEYPSRPGPYILGFFAGITVETDGVIIDLNGFTISQSIRFYLLQRFFSLIELANSPFISKQGPSNSGNFGLDYKAAKNVLIKNGKLGLSSHHGIHGNSPENIYISNITITNFEVGGIALNGSKNVVIDNNIIQDSMGAKLKVPVNGRFSAIVYLWRTLNLLIKKGYGDYTFNIGKEILTIDWLYNYWNNNITKLTNIVVDNKLYTLPKFPEPLNNFFSNPGGFQDCSAVYGILLHKRGVAINDFGCCNSNIADGTTSDNSIIKNTIINNLIFKPREVVGLLDNNRKMMVDFSNSLVMLTDDYWQYDNDYINKRFNDNRPFKSSDGNYDMILATQACVYECAIKNNIKWAKGVGNISNSLLEWIHNGNIPYNRITSIDSFRNSDIMGHVMKGAIAIRLDFINNVHIEKVNISNISNYGLLGISNNILTPYIDGKIDKGTHLGHIKSDDRQIGYTGNHCRAISIINSTNIKIVSTDISNLFSTNGSVYGIDWIDNNLDGYMENNIIKTLSSGSRDNLRESIINTTLPNPLANSVGIIVRQNNNNINSFKNKIEDLSSKISTYATIIEAGLESINFKVNGQGKNSTTTYKLTDNIKDIVNNKNL